MSKLNYSHDPHYPGLSSQPLHTGNNTIGTVKKVVFKIKTKKLLSFSEMNLESILISNSTQNATQCKSKTEGRSKIRHARFDKMQLQENEILFKETLLNVNHRFFKNHKYSILKEKI